MDGNDGTTISYMKLKTTCLINYFFNYAKHKPLIIVMQLFFTIRFCMDNLYFERLIRSS